MTGQFDPPDLQMLAKQLMAVAGPAETKALLDALMSGQVTSIFERLNARAEPTLRPVPEAVRGFRVRLDLRGAKPPVWRRLELPGDLPLPRLHDVIQAAMGWYDCHLHRFRTGRDHRSPYFVTAFDLEEGEEGLLEDDVRLDQLLVDKGDELWYEYDFGDGWDHRLVVEKVLDAPPEVVRCTAGRMACPPEDCGGLGGYEEIVTWVRSGYDDDLLPQGFEDAEHGRGWLPFEWHPDDFDIAETNPAGGRDRRADRGDRRVGRVGRPARAPGRSSAATAPRGAGRPRPGGCQRRGGRPADRDLPGLPRPDR